MTIKEAFSILEIEPTDDVKTVKKAYAGMVKKYHPEEQPEKWKEIHDAYESIMKRVGNQKGPTQMQQAEILKNAPKDKKIEQAEKAEQRERPKPPEQRERPEPAEQREQPKQPKPSEKMERPEPPEQFEQEENFEDLSEFVDIQREKERTKRKEKEDDVIAQLADLVYGKNRNVADWEKLFLKDENLEGLASERFLHSLEDFLPKIRMSRKLYRMLKNQLKVIECYQNERKMSLKKTGLLWQSVAYQVSVKLMMLYGKYEAKQQSQPKVKRMFLIMICTIVIVLGIFLKGYINYRSQPRRQTTEYVNPDWDKIFRDVESDMFDNDLSGAEKTITMLQFQSSKDEMKQEIFAASTKLKEGIYVGKLPKYGSKNEQEASEWADGPVFYFEEEENNEDMVRELLQLKGNKNQVYAFTITSDTIENDILSWLDLEKLHFSTECAIYYYTGVDGYVRVEQYTKEHDLSNDRCRYDILGYCVLPIETGGGRASIIITERN